MIIVNGWFEGGMAGVRKWNDECSVIGEGEKNVWPDFLKRLLHNFSRRSCNDGNRELIPVFHNSHRKYRPSPSAVACILECLVGVPFWAASSRREEKQVRINIQKSREYLEGGYQVNTKSSPLRGMKAHPLQSLFVGEVTHASYQPCSLSLISL